MEATLIIENYIKNGKTIRDLSDEFKISTKRISKLLELNNIPKKRRNNNKDRVLSNNTKNKISSSLKGKSTSKKGTKMTLAQRYVNIRAQLKLDKSVDLSKYEDIDLLLEITKHLIKIPKSKKNPKYILEFISKFYNDLKFNQIYSFWKNSNFNKWARPSLDHIIPKSKGGEWNLDNLQCMTWFENRCKCDMTMDEWINFKNNSQTVSEYFI